MHVNLKILSLLLLSMLALSACVIETERPQTSKLGMKDVQKLQDKVLYCRVGTGAINSAGKWFEFYNKDFSIFREGRTNIKLRSKETAEAKPFQVILNNSGQKILFCPLINLAAGEKVRCQSFYFLEDDLEVGFKRTLNLGNTVRQSAITCSYNPERLKPLN